MTDTVVETVSPEFRQNAYRKNFYYFLSDGILFSVAMALMGATTVVPDFVRQLTSSDILIGLSGSLFDIGWTLPQLFVARYIVRFARKKPWFVGPNIPVRFVILLFAILMVIIGPDQPQTILILFFVCYGIAALGDGLVGVPWADLTGTSMEPRSRARMFGLQSAIAGGIMLLVSPLIALVLSDNGPGFPGNYAIVFGAAGILFVLSIIPTLFIIELPGGKAIEKLPSMREFLPYLGSVLRTDGTFRGILIARMLTTLTAMASPFYIGFATVQLGLSSEVAVPTLLAVQTVGAVSGALFYAWLGARNNLLYIRLALVGTALLPISALVASQVGPWPLYIGFLMSGLTLSNLFLSYHQHVITHASADQRPIYAGLFNTINALTAMCAPLIAGTIAQYLGYVPLFVVSLIMCMLALYVTLRYLSNQPPANTAASN